jgi:hypothetical protein
VVTSGIIGEAGAQTRSQLPQRFGVVAGPEDAATVQALGAGWEQVTFDWSVIQPDGPDNFEPEAVDPDRLVSAQAAGREVVGLIVDTPAWASDSGDPSAVPDGLDLPVDDPDNVWAAFVTRLVESYADIHHWIIYDAPDVLLGEGEVRFAGTVEDYARLVKVAYLAATAADPGAVIHLAGFNWWGDVAAGRDPYLARLVRVLSDDPDAAAYDYYFDVVTLRVLNDIQAVWDVVTQVRAILERARLAGKTIWLETNASPTLDPELDIPEPLFGVTLAMQADFVVQAAAASLALGVQRLAVYRLADVPEENPPWGLIRADGTRRPAFDAYQTVIELFTPTLAATRYDHTAADLVVLEQGGRDVYVLWARDTHPVTYLITSPRIGETARLLDPAGNNRRVTSQDAVWPAAFEVSVPAARRDANGFLTVAGSPRILVLDQDEEFYRVVYATVGGVTVRLR